jgi:hypothetical protein
MLAGRKCVSELQESQKITLARNAGLMEEK